MGLTEQSLEHVDNCHSVAEEKSHTAVKSRGWDWKNGLLSIDEEPHERTRIGEVMNDFYGIISVSEGGRDNSRHMRKEAEPAPHRSQC